MNKMLLLGDDAVAQAAIDAGITTAYGYPGTPSTEILEYLQRSANNEPTICARWAANEKVAYEQAVGSSFAGRRTIVTMKHVGVNVAADPLMNSAITGAHGGLVLAVADDPSMHSSQNEQDSRFYSDYAQIMCFEPSTQQEAYDMTREAFDASENLGIPVMIRLVTRLAHSRADVVVRPKREPNRLNPTRERGRWVLIPSNARPQYRRLIEKQDDIRRYSEKSAGNELYLSPQHHQLGVIVSGIAYNYFREAFGDDELPSFLKIGVYPIPEQKLKALCNHVEKILVLEEGYPFIEGKLFGLLGDPEHTRCMGRTSGSVPRWGELNPDIVSRALGKNSMHDKRNLPLPLSPRPPQLCAGCPHRDAFTALSTVKSQYPAPAVFGDIGCYTLGYYKPFEAIDSCLDMGASISMAKGAADAGMFPVFSYIGDSTFGHSGLGPLLTAAHENTNMVVIIGDNSTVAMTGTQESLSTGDRLVDIVAGLGVPREHIRVWKALPKYAEENAKILKEEVEHIGLSVIISQRPCLELR